MADRRHKRDTDARRTPRATLVAGPLALVATASVISLGVVLSDAPASETITARTTAAESQTKTKRKLSLLPMIIVCLVAMNLISG